GTASLFADTNSFGVFLDGSFVTAEDGSITVTGQGSSESDNRGDGVDLWNSSLIETTGLGNVTINGTATLGSGAGYGVRLRFGSAIEATATGNVVINGSATPLSGLVDIRWDDLTIAKTGGSYVFNGSTLSTKSLIALPGSYNGVINATALGITFQGVLEVE